MEKVILIGGGGHCASVIDTIHRAGFLEPIGILDIPEKKGTSIGGVPVMGVDEDLQDIFDCGISRAFITLGSIGNTKIREKLKNQAKQIGYHFPVIIDPTAVIATDVTIGEGTFIGKNVVINVGSSIGNHSIINTGTIIEHGCQIGDYVHTSPSTSMSGDVKIGNRTHVGTNCTLIQGVTISEDVLIGAGSVVLRDISAGKTAYGNPCREANR